MNPDDPRHSTHAGYIAGCRNECCRTARRRAQKQRQLHRLQTGQNLRIPHHQFLTAIQPWLTLGISPYALEEAAHINSRIADVLRNQTAVLRTTYDAINNLTENDIPNTAKVHATLTRQRIDSLMAIGHRLTDMPINSRGHWRKRTLITVGTARAIRDHYQTLEATIGDDPHTQARARNRGALPPFAWDDPGTLAWPDGKPVRLKMAADNTPATHAYDPVVVERILAGDRLEPSVAERRAVVERLWTRGLGPVGIAARCGFDKDTVGKDIERLGLKRGAA